MGTINIKATVAPLIPVNTKSLSRVNAPPGIRSPKGVKLFGGDLSNSLAGDLESLNQSVNSLQLAMKQSPAISQLQITNSAGQTTSSFGPVTVNGVVFTNYFSELHVGDPQLTLDPTMALFNANADGSVTVGKNGYLDVYDPYGASAAWIGTQNDVQFITGAVNNGAGLIRLLVVAHTCADGDTVTVRNMQFYGIPNATGTFVVTSFDVDHIDLRGSVWSGTFTVPVVRPGINTQAATVDRVLLVDGAVASVSHPGPPAWIRIHTQQEHGYETGDRVSLANVGGVPNADGQWTITAFGNTGASAHIFDLQGSTFAGAYTAGGTCLRYFAGILAQTFAIGNSFTDYKLRAFADGSLKINNATITLTSANGKIVLDPNVPSLTLFDSGNNPAVTIEVLTESPLPILTATNAAPSVLEVTAHGYVTGDTVVVAGSTGNTTINGRNIVVRVDANHFSMTTFAGAPVNGNGAYTGSGTSTRYYAGMLADTMAIGDSFTNYKLRAFADGTLVINGAVIASVPTLTFTEQVAPGVSAAGTSLLYADSTSHTLRISQNGAGFVDVVTLPAGSNTQVQFNNSGLFGASANLTFAANILTSGSGAGTGFAGPLYSATAGGSNLEFSGTAFSVTGQGKIATGGWLDFTERSAPAAAASHSILYADSGTHQLYLSNNGGAFVAITPGVPAGSNTQLQFNNSGAFGASASLTWNGIILTASFVSTGGLTVTSTGISVTTGDIDVGTGNYKANGGTGFTGTLAAAIAAAKSVQGGIILT